MPVYAPYLCFKCGLPGCVDTAVFDEAGNIWDSAHAGCIDGPSPPSPADWIEAMWPFRGSPDLTTNATPEHVDELQ